MSAQDGLATSTSEAADKKGMNWHSVVLIGVVAGLSSVFGAWVVNGWPGSFARIDGELVRASEEINRNLPTLVDKWTRLDATTAAPGKQLIYRYTLVTDGPLEEVLPDKDVFVDKLMQQCQNNYRTSSDMEWYRRSGVTLVYAYFDEVGEEYARFEVKPE